MMVIMFVLLLASGLFADNESAAAAQALGVGNTCHCGVFKDGDNGMGEPLIHTMNNTNGIECNDKGSEECKKKCIMEAMAVKENVATIICEALKTAIDGYKPALYYKVCDDPKWVYSGHTCEQAFCCQDEKPITCREPTEPHE